MGMASKYAAQETFLSKRFFLFYFVVMINMLIYAIVWQQVIKKIPLTTAYANKLICIIWMALLGTVFFNEVINIKK